VAFLPLKAQQWIELEQEFGKNNVDKYFIPISKKSKMFG